VDWILAKYTAAGAYAGHVFCDGGRNGTDIPFDLKTHANNVVVAGRRASPVGHGFMTATYDSALVPLWVSYWPTGDGFDGQARALAINSQGGIYVTGYYREGIFGNDYLTTNFGQVWIYDASSRRVPGMEDFATAIAIDSNDDVYITGASVGINGQGYDYLTMKLRSGQPPYAWNPIGRRFTSAGNGDDIPVAIAVDHDRNVYVTGYSPAAGQGLNIVTVKYSSNGDVLW
jgi:hypothetical protein